MERDRLSHLAHERHPVACPFSDDTVASLVGRLEVPRTASILDVGCGRGEWVVRLLEAHPHAKAVAVDRSEPALEAAGRRAREAGVKDRLVLYHGEGRAYLRSSGNVHDLIVCTGSDHVFGSQADALRILCPRLTPEGLILFAAGFWNTEPAEAALEALGQDLRDALPIGLPALVGGVMASSLTPLHVVVASEREWDDYEWSWIASLEEHARRHPEEDSEQLRDVAREHREGYLGGYRGQLGFAAVIARRAD